ncbi:hypothetical protein GGI35DRAFT_408201 [Trichoderma velutinum]
MILDRATCGKEEGSFISEFCFIPECFFLRFCVCIVFAWELGMPRRRLSRLSCLGRFLMSGYGVTMFICWHDFSYLAFLLFFYCAARGKIYLGREWGSFGLQFAFIFAHRKRGSGCDKPVYRQNT